MTARADVSRYQPAVVVGAALAGLFWGLTGVVALLDPGPDPGPVGSTTFYLIEGGHALGHTGMFVALIGLWRSQRSRIGRVGSGLVGLAAGASVLLAVVTYLVVGAAAMGLRPNELEGETPPALLVAVASAIFLVGLIGLVAGYVGGGVVTTRGKVWPPPVGWLLVPYPFLLFVNLVFYPIGMAIGALWIGLAVVAGRARPPSTP